MKHQLWLQNLTIALPICPQIAVHGNVNDYFIIDKGGGEARPMLAAEAIFEAVKPKGFVSVIVLNTSVGCRALAERSAQGESILEKLGISNGMAFISQLAAKARTLGRQSVAAGHCDH